MRVNHVRFRRGNSDNILHDMHKLDLVMTQIESNPITPLHEYFIKHVFRKEKKAGTFWLEFLAE